MNPTNEPIKESEFVLRRLGESFTQFRQDLWSSVPLWLLIFAALAVVARVGYARYYRKTHGHAKPDSIQFWLGWTAIITVAALVGSTLIQFYDRDGSQLKGSTSQLSALGQSNAQYWYVFTAGIFVIGAVYVALMYAKDSKTVKWYWAVKLAILRITVYALLCFVFLLPARQTWERTEKRSRVVVLVDISPSLTRVSDEISRKGAKQKTRMDTLIDFLSDKDVALIQKLLEQNPVAIYPFGTRLDDSSRMIERDETPWGPTEWRALAEYDFRPFMLKGLEGKDIETLKNSTNPVEWAGPKPSPGVDRPEPTNWAEWASKWVEYRAKWAAKKAAFEAERGGKEPFTETLVNGLSEPGNKILADNLEKLEKRVDVAKSIALGTNVPDSVAAAINRESPNMVQGVIVFSDMRSNLGSDSSYRELRSAANHAKIPVFMVAVGEDRQNTSISITDVQTDDVASPDEGFKVSVEADGVNLAGKSVPVELDLFLPGSDPKTAKPSYTLKDSRPDKSKGSFTPYTITFAPGDPPHGAVEFVIDPAKLAVDPDADARNLTTESKDAAIKKPVLREGAWMVKARIPRDENEVFPDEFHVRERPGIQVIQKKIRILAIAGAPSREFQFIRTFLNREVLENRATLTVLIQNEAGTTGKLTPNPTEKVIGRFPTKLDLTSKEPDPEQKQYNLNEYDVIVAFDPDWTEVSQQQADDLKLWVERQGGGLVLIADRINTYQLARVEMNSRLSPILDILPVLPDDVIAVKIKAIPKTPRRLYMHPMPGSDLLKIDDPPPSEKKDGKEPENDPVAGWERFFTDQAKYAESKDYKTELFPRRGFFSCYPIKDVKPGAHVLAEFADVDDRNEKITRPYIVVSNPAAGFRTCYMGSGEIYRMYAYDKEYYERYWAKMIKYMAGKRNVKASRGRVITNKEIISTNPIRVTAQLLNTNSKPYPEGSIDPKFNILRVSPNGDKKIEGPFPLTASGAEGYFRGQVGADPRLFPPGDYEYFAIVDVPDSNSETVRSGFRILKSDLEMDMTKPDIAAMLAMASPIDSLQERVPEKVRSAFAAGLPKEGGMAKLAFKLSDKALIKLIPECFKTDTRRYDHRGPVEDLWDEKIALVDIDRPGIQEWLQHRGFRARVDKNERAATPLGDFLTKGPRVFRSSATDTLPTDRDGQLIVARAPNSQIAVSWVIFIVVTLLCWEWLTRKLLRLA
ncbi:MAG: hypothetical protein C0467_16740 [Planctomycetaceae bacterium]|nr:hypothetical protein [Planctomycetaceae bacterium]